MNISITNLCNRRCEYCFQRSWYLSKKAIADSTTHEMSVDTIKDLIKWGENTIIKLLGGEPLLHSRIFDILQCFRNAQKQVCLISNISVDSTIVQNLTQYTDICKSVLCNTDYPDSQRDVFHDNLRILLKSDIEEISLSTTLLPDKDSQIKTIERILSCLNDAKQIRDDLRGINLRISPYCPLSATDLSYKPHDYKCDLVDFFNSILSQYIVPISFDCPVEYDEVDFDTQQVFHNAGITINKKPCIDTVGAFDVLTDGSIIWCSSCNDIAVKSYKDYRTYEDAVVAIKKLVQDEVDKLSNCNKFNCLAKARIKNAISIKSIP